MRKLLLGGLIAAALLPNVAQAQSYRELREDRQDIRREEQQLRNAYRYGDRRDVREQRRDVRDARREYREDLADRNRRFGRDDWRGWRQNNRALYARGGWRAPFRYQTFRPGVRIPAGYWGTRYVIADPWRYHLPPAAGYQRWVRHYDDVVLVDTRRGIVTDVIRGFYW